MRLALLLLVLAGCGGHATTSIAVGSAPQVVAPVVAAAEFSGVPLTSDVMFVVDRSTSMTSDMLADAKRELLRALDRMPDGAHVGIVFFDDTVTVLGDLDRDLDGRAEDPTGAPRDPPPEDSERVVLSSATRPSLRRFVRSIGIRRDIAIHPVLKSFGWSFDDRAAKQLVLVSGGIAPSSYDARALLDQVFHLRHQAGVRIDTVAFRRNQDVALLAQVARTAGGVAIVRD